MTKYENEIQNKLDSFLKERNWDSNLCMRVYNMLCNVTEETGELWNVIKWIDNDEQLQEIKDKKKAELADGVGDLAWCIAALANAFEVDMEKALRATHAEYEQRFPANIVKDKHGNPNLGGYDGKYAKNSQ